MAAPSRSELIEQLTATFIDKAVTIKKLKEQTLASKDEKPVSSNGSLDTSTVDLSRDLPSQLVSLDAGGNQSAVYPPNMFAPQAQAFYYGGYENISGDWEGYPQYLNAESMDVASTGVYNENPSLMFHGGYGYNPQMPYGPYSPATTPLPGASDGQLYSPQHFPFTGHYYPQLATSSMPYLAPSTPMSQADLTMPIDQQGTFLAGNSNSNGMLFGLQPGYHLSYESFGRGSFAGNSENLGFYDLRQGFDGFGSGGFWSEWPKIPDGTGSLTPLSSPAASSQPIGAVGSFGQNMTPFASGMASQQQRSLSSYESLMSFYGKGSSHGGMYQGSNSGPSPSLGSSGRNLMTIDKSRSRGKGNTSFCNCNDVLDILSEQNRGPRASRPKNSAVEQNESLDGKNERSTAGPEHEIYNNPDFVTEYKDAKFFIIKSYSEDNVHKSIKYGVWASTMNGNRKLDGAYREAKVKGDFYPVFLFFSVNASAQFCGVAEMTGPVDFEKSVDYWQQDKWTGQFPVKWHIIKDVPNNLFRHIILENNDNKPVTNSRDTQEVKLDQGLEMLSIFKKHELDTSMLDDFDFYEEREKAIQERKARQKQNSTGVVPAVIGNEQRNPISIDFVHQLSKSFADVVRVEEGSAAEPVVQTSILVTVADKTEEIDKS